MNSLVLDNLIIPEGVSFADLQLTRDADTGCLWYDVDAVHRFCQGNNIDAESLIEDDEDGLCALITRWHALHVAQGGRRDDVQSMISAEVEAEALVGAGAVSRSSLLIQ